MASFLSTAPNPAEQNPAQIGLNLYLSSVHPAQNVTVLTNLGITHILNLTGPDLTGKPRYASQYFKGIHYKHLCLPDEQHVKISNYFDAVFAFLDEGTKPGNCILVHCEAGISRSSTVVIAYLMKKARLSLKEAYEHVLSRKSNIAPNEAFFQQLIEFEKKQFHSNSISLTDYLACQILKITPHHTIDLIKDVLIQCGNNSENAINLLISI